MNKKYKQKFPGFCSDDITSYDLVLSNDLDSLLVSNFLINQKFYQIKYFYDFDNLYLEKDYTQDNKIIGCDIDFADTRAKSWGNHVTLLSDIDCNNSESANLNNVCHITSQNYTDKYAGSTILTVLSYYDYDISNLTDYAKKLLLCVDSHYLGLYSKFHDTQKKWLVDVLGYPALYDIIQKTKIEEFVQLQEEYKLKGQIYINQDGYLETDIDLEAVSDVLHLKVTLPEIKFVNCFNEIELKKGYVTTSSVRNKNEIHKDLFSLALTYANSAIFSYLVKV